MLWKRQDGKPASTEAGTAPPDSIGKYQMLGEIGRGACGIVYKGFDPFVQREVAIKIARTPADALERTRDNHHERAFFAEARAAGPVHPGVAEAVIGRALLGIGEDRIGLVDLLEPPRRVLAAAVAVGVVFHGELAEGSLEAGRVAGPLDAEDFIIIAHQIAGQPIAGQ